MRRLLRQPSPQPPRGRGTWRRRRLPAAIAAGLLVAVPVAAAATGPRAERPGARQAAGEPPPPKADRDADRVFDRLEARLERLGERDRVDVIVMLREPASRERVERLEREVGGFEVGRRFSLVDAFSATVTKGQAQALARRRGVVHVEENSRVRALNDSAQSSFGVSEARQDAPGLDGDADGNPNAYSKDDLVAAVIDTGIDAGHADLDESKVIAWRDFVNNRSSPYDDNGHGTHVAATLAGDGEGTFDRRHRGVAPQAALVGAKVLNANGAGLSSHIIAAIDWVVANRAAYGIEAINLSLGIDGCSDGTDTTSAAVNRAHDAGLVVAVAAGNEGPGTCTIGAPAAAAKALTVGAMADLGAGGFHQARFSSRGKTADGRIKPDVSAPGVAVTSAQAGSRSGYENMGGTSMATPFVAGVALLLREASPALSSQQVKDTIRTTAIDWGRGGDSTVAGSNGADIEYGAGRLDAYAALRTVGATIDSPLPAPAHQLIQGSVGATGDVRDYPIEVVTTAFPIAATLIVPDITGGTATNPDLDLYLLDPDGNRVDASELVTRQEDVSRTPAAIGTYTLRVVSFKGAANFFVDVSAGLDPATTPPDSVVDSGPSGTVASPDASFEFHATAAASTFECRIDGGRFTTCSSPATYTGLSDGPHAFEVRATNTAGDTDPTPARREWTVNTPTRDRQSSQPDGGGSTSPGGAEGSSPTGDSGSEPTGGEPSGAEPGPLRLAGTAGADCPLSGGGHADEIDGAGGADCLVGGAGGDTLGGGSGDDRLDGGDGVDVMSGGPGRDALQGGAERDFMTGDEGDDEIDGGAGSNVIDGGIGDDEIVGGERADSLNGGSDEDVIRGGDGGDGITGASGRDRLFGEGGDDRIEGGLGKDYIDGGDGDDNIVAIDGQPDVVRCGRGRDVVRADGGDRVARDCEQVIGRAGTSARDTSASADSADARATRDDGIGQGGATLTGGGELRGTPGDDTIDSPLAPSTLLGLAGMDLLSGGVAGDRAEGGDGTDILSGGPGDDTLLGGSARDFVSGGPGEDRLEGGAGSNIMNGAQGNDVLIGGAFADSLNGGSDEDVIRGGAGDDGITGASGRDELFGQEGDDRIEGGLGKDVIDGGDGGDNIVAADGQVDVIRCGRGRDVVRADGDDRVARDCERVIARRDNAYVVVR